MDQLIRLFGDAIVGVCNGFDRIVFQGMIRPLMYPEGAMSFFQRQGVLFKDAKQWVLEQTARLVSAVDELSRRECGVGTTYLPSLNIRKEEVARRRQREKGITEGLVGTWSCLETGGSYRLMRADGAPRLVYYQPRCKHLYVYLDHLDYGFMSIRIQTWFPYRIQVAMNGREWLGRQLEKAGVGFVRHGNKILQVDDFAVIQPLLDQQLTTNWCALLDSFVPTAFPTFGSTLGTGLSYTWNLWQSEWATDFLFKDRSALDRMLEAMVRHAFIGGHPERVIRYFGQPLKRNGEPRANFGGSLKTTVLKLDDGWRARHWYGRNSVKLYNELNTLRLETTVNDAAAFKAYRRKQGAPETASKVLLPLRKGVADTTLRAQACQAVNDRFAEHLASTRSEQPFIALLTPVTTRKRRRRRSVRALDLTGKDLPILTAVADPKFTLAGFCNRDLRLLLADSSHHRGKTERQRSASVTRALRLLRDHGIIRKVPKRRRYHLTTRGRRIVTSLLAALAASTQDLAAIAA